MSDETIISEVLNDDATMNSLAASMIETFSTTTGEQQPTSAQLASRAQIMALLQSLVAGSEPSSEDECRPLVATAGRGRGRGGGGRGGRSAHLGASLMQQHHETSSDSSDGDIDEETVVKVSGEAACRAVRGDGASAPPPSADEDDDLESTNSEAALDEMLKQVMKAV